VDHIGDYSLVVEAHSETAGEWSFRIHVTGWGESDQGLDLVPSSNAIALMLEKRKDASTEVQFVAQPARIEAQK